jgi:hypothetical protein
MVERAEGPAPPRLWRFAPAPFAPGRYTNTLVRTTRATHARQHIREEMESSFALELENDGSATLCRRWRYISTNRGPRVQTEERIREQLGYRGRWRRAGEEVHVELERDDTVCPRVGEYLELIPRHEDRWELVCHPVVALEGGDEAGGGPRGSPLPGPMLLCPSPFPSPRFGEDEPHLVGGVILEGDGRDPGPHRWIVLAAGDGVQIRAERRSVEAGEEEQVQMRPGEDSHEVGS